MIDEFYDRDVKVMINGALYDGKNATQLAEYAGNEDVAAVFVTKEGKYFEVFRDHETVAVTALQEEEAKRLIKLYDADFECDRGNISENAEDEEWGVTKLPTKEQMDQWDMHTEATILDERYSERQRIFVYDGIRYVPKESTLLAEGFGRLADGRRVKTRLYKTKKGKYFLVDRWNNTAAIRAESQALYWAREELTDKEINESFSPELAQDIMLRSCPN